MTDWWAKCNTECKSEGSKELLQSMVRAENDVYMVCGDANTKSQSILDGLNQGYITRGELQRCVKNICNWILKTNTFKEYMENDCEPKYPITVDDENMTIKSVIENPKSETEYDAELSKGTAVMIFSVRCDSEVLAQNPITVSVNDLNFTFSVCGTQGEFVNVKRSVNIANDSIYKIAVNHKRAVKIENIVIKQ